MFPNAQDALPLPRRPNPERYKQPAQELVQTCKSDDKEAIEDWAEKWATALAKQSGIEFRRPLPAVAARWAGEIARFVRRELDEHGGECCLADARRTLRNAAHV